MNFLAVNISTRLILATLALTEGTRVGNALGVFFQNRYEGAQPNGPRRSWIPAFVRDARYDANSFSRWEMVRKVRYFERNTWLVQRLRDEFAKWTVGPNGLQCVPDSSDSDWNDRMLESYLGWCEQPFLDSTLTMSQGHRLLAGEYQVEGEMFVNKTRRKVSGKQSEPAIQLIEGHRVSSPGYQFDFPDAASSGLGMRGASAVAEGGLGGQKASSYQVDGVEVDERGAPLGYWVRDGFAGDSWSFRSIADMHHVLDPSRVGMYRDITPYHACLNTLHDLEDLEQMEMERAKQNSEVANILTNPAGEINPVLLRRERFMKPGGPPAGSPTPDEDLAKRIEMYRTILGSRTIALKTGEELKQFGSASPSAATQWYWRYKLGQICAAAGVPMILVFPEMIETMQGTVARGIYDNAHLFFRGKSHVFAHCAAGIYRFYAQWARYNIPDLADAPADWGKVHVILPRAVNVDIGRNSAAKLAELAAGLTNYDDEAGSVGTTAKVLLRKKARNISLIHKIAEEEGIEPAEIAAPLADILQKLAMANGAQSEDEDENEDDPAGARQSGRQSVRQGEEEPA